MQVDLEHADALSSAAKAINPADGSYDPQSVLTAYALLEAEYGELTQLQRGSAEYIARAKELTEQTTASVYEQAAAYGVVTNRQAQAAQAAADGQRERRFKRVEENGYQGGVSYLESTVRKAEEAGEDVTAAWNNALDELDAAGHLDAMRGHTTTYWEEVEEIIAGGDDAIIQFLKDNCQDYKDAGKLQAEAYVDEWKKKLEDLRNAYKQVSGDIKSYDYTPTTSAKGSGSSSSGGGSSGKKSGGSSAKVTKYKATYPAIGKAKGGTLSGYSSPEEAEKAARSKINSICRELSGSSSSMIGEWARSFYSKIKGRAYAKGGLNQATGLAWLDGTKAKPERVLSPYQTELFEDLLKTLHAIRTVQVPQAVVRPQLPETVQNQPLTIESITVNVERLEKEADYDTMAERVGEKIMERAMRGMAVGGLRLG